MRLANANPSGDIKDQVSQKFSELAKAQSNGGLDIQVYSGGSLGDWRDTIEGLGLGVNEIVIESMSSLDSYYPKANIDALPYLFDGYDHLMKVWYGPVGEKIMEDIGKNGNFKLIGPMYRGVRKVTSKKPFNTLEELKGLKIRVPNTQVFIKLWQTLGTNPTPLALTETFTAIQQNTVEAQENPVIESYGFAFYDVCKYLIETNHVYSTDVWIYNRPFFEKQPAEIQKVLVSAGVDAAKWRNEEAKKRESEFVQKFKDKGVTVITPDLAPFRTKLEGFVEKEFPDLKDWVAEIKAAK